MMIIVLKLISWQAMITCSSGPTVAEDWRNGFCSSAAAENALPARTRTLTVLKSLFFSQEDSPAPETHRTVRHFGQKKMALLWIWLSHIRHFCFNSSLNRVANFVEICNIYANHLVINAAKS